MPTIVLQLLGPVLLAAALPLLAVAVVPERRGAPRRRAAVPVEHDVPPPFAPRSVIHSIERNLQLAGLTGRWSLRTIVLSKLLLAIAGLLLGVGLVALQPGAVTVLLGVVLAVLGYFVPDLVVAGRARERQHRIQAELADTLDQIMIAVEAGVGLETAVARASQHGRGPLAAEFGRALQDMRLGMTRREAYTALAERTTVVDLRRFARAIMQADEYGVSIASVVRSQARELRIKRRQRAEEKALKVPVQVLFPLMFCILPVLFIVVLGPAVVNLVTAFSAL